MSQKISHIGVVVRDLDAAIRLWTDTFGFTQVHRIDAPEESIRTAMMSPSGAHGEMAVELLEPIDKTDMSNPVARRLAKFGEGFYHMAMVVDDVEASAETLGGRGVTVIERPAAALGAAFQGVVSPEACRQIVHPKFSNGIIIELLQRAE